MIDTNTLPDPDDLEILGARRRHNGLAGRDSFHGFSSEEESRYHAALNRWAHGGKQNKPGDDWRRLGIEAREVKS